MLRKALSIVALTGGLALAADPALAQDQGRFYLGAGLGGFRVSADPVDGTSPAASIVGGVRLLPWLDLEADVTVPSEVFTRSYGSTDELSLSFAPPGSSREEIERMGIWLRYDKQRDVTMSFSTVVIFHPSEKLRVSPGVVVGITSQRVQDRTDYTPLRLGAGLPPDHRYASAWTESGSRVMGALTCGGQLRIAVTRHFTIVPDLRYDYGSIGDEINNTLRVSVRTMWKF